MNATTKKHRPAPPAHGVVSDQLRGIITARRLTPYSVARSAGIAPSVMTRFVNGERGLTLDTFDRVADALGLRLVEVARRGKGNARREREPAGPADRPGPDRELEAPVEPMPDAGAGE